MEIIRSWEFDNKLLKRNICLILKIYSELSKNSFPSVDDIDVSLENLNREILSSKGSYTDEEIDNMYEELESQGQFACMSQFIESIVDKQKMSICIDNNTFDESQCIINDAQNILGPHQIINDGLVFQGKDIVQILRKQDNLLRLEA